MELKKGYLVLVFLLFVIALLLYLSFSTQIVFHDTPEYYSVTKDLAGYGNVGVYSTHSFVYSFFVAPFVRIFPSFLTIKLVNMFWLLLDTLLVFLFFKDKRVFLLWVFSPLVWLVSVQYSPILPASFFTLLMYLAFIKWESTKKSYFFVISALSGGMTFALYEPSIILIVFFMLSFFYKKSLLTSLLFLLLMFPTFAVRLLVDYVLTGFPFYSLVRYFGSNLAVVLGYNPGTSLLHGFASLETVYSLFLITPLLFMFFKVDFSKNKRLLLFVLLSSLFFFLRSGLVKYFLLIAPLIFLLLSSIMTKKLLVINSILSVILIVIFSQGSFATDYSKLVAEDMRLISIEYPSAHYVDAADASLYTWDGGYKFYNIYEYFNAATNSTYYSDYNIVVGNKRVNLYQILELKAALKPNYGADILTSPLLMEKGAVPLEGFKLQKCYQYLCLYKK